MKLPTLLQNKAGERLQQLFTQALTHNELRKYRHALHCPSLLFNQRGKIAASAVLQKNLIKLNASLYSDNTDYFLQQVIAHELAHIMVYQLYGRSTKPHGKEWQHLMLAIFTIPAHVTHCLDVSKVAMQKFMYQCDCQKIPLSLIRHNKVLRNKQIYHCRLCHGVLRWQNDDN